MIDELRLSHKLNKILKVAGLSKSTYEYYKSSKHINSLHSKALKEDKILSIVVPIFNHHKKRYGVRRVHKELTNRGYDVNHKRVQRIMHKLGLFGKRPKEKYHSYKGEVGKVADNIINRDFSTTKPLEKWTTDVSQFNLPFGKCYISPVLDMNNNEVISYNLSQSPNMEQVKDMLKESLGFWDTVALEPEEEEMKKIPGDNIRWCSCPLVQETADGHPCLQMCATCLQC